MKITLEIIVNDDDLKPEFINYWDNHSGNDLTGEFDGFYGDIVSIEETNEKITLSEFIKRVIKQVVNNG